ncbi:unnamed protein product [Adineta ricciae]|uniref:Uncharacterized protein n=1 Tax=Adineta ricciae TaxID=249248 RepID=A0A814R6H5_ADIRI|nr:unnamed protein product [Adineta ricciae]CAF1236826.1 unnamed protein product [Adineta ricciae]
MSNERDGTVTVYVGDLSEHASEEDIRSTFSTYGTIENMWLSRKPAGYGFIDFRRHRDAADAVRALNGKLIGGSSVRVEFSHGRGRMKASERTHRKLRSPSSSVRRRFSPRDVCYECGSRGHYGYDCEIRLRRQQRNRSKQRSRSPRRRRTHRHNEQSSSRRSKRDHRRSRSKNRSRSKSDSYSRSRSRSR